MKAWVMTDLYLSHTIPFELKYGWDEAVHLTKEIDIFETLSPIRLQAAARIMDIVMNEEFPEEIGNARWDLLAPWILSFVPPARDNIVTLIYLGKEEWDIRRVILQVAIQCNDDISRCCLNPRIKCRGLTEILPEHNKLNRVAYHGFLTCLVPRTVIDKDNLVRVTGLFQCFLNPPMEFEHIPLLIIERDDD